MSDPCPTANTLHTAGGPTPEVVAAVRVGLRGRVGELAEHPKLAGSFDLAKHFTGHSSDLAAEQSRTVRIAVIDIGSNSVRLVVADCHLSGPPTASGQHTSSAGDRSGIGAGLTGDFLAASMIVAGVPESSANSKKPQGGRTSLEPTREPTRVLYKVIAEQRAATQLVRGLDGTGLLDPQAMEHSAAAIRDMVNIATDLGVPVGKIRAMATCAVREARNRKEFGALVRRWSGLKIRTISAKKEAKFAFSSAKASFDLAKIHSNGAAVIDVGGGSTEVILTGRKRKAGRIKRIFLLPTGAVRATERFGGPDVAAADRYEELLGFARKIAKNMIWEVDRRPGVLIGVGGTITALARMLLAAGHGRGDLLHRLGERESILGGLTDAVQGMAITQEDVQAALLALRALDSSTRRDVPGMSKDRADTIIGGLVIVLAVMERLGCPTLIVHVGGIRDGILRRAARKELAIESMGELKPAAKP